MSNIQWTEETWNPIVGCTKVSKGCDNCYAIRMSHRLKNTFDKYNGLTKRMGNGDINWNGVIRYDEENLELPKKWKRPRKIFVNSMSDLFHENVPYDYIRKIFDVMLTTTQHIYQILTKRPDNMIKFFELYYSAYRLPDNIWLGVSVEDQESANNRIPQLIKISAGVKWISAEPLLGKVDFTMIHQTKNPGVYCPLNILKDKRVNWIVIGGESGPRARRAEPKWFYEIIKSCKRYNVPVFMKQFGSFLAKQYNMTHPKGGNISEFPSKYQVREYPE